MRKEIVPTAIISNQKSMMVSQTKHPAKKRMKTVKSIETMNAKPTVKPSKGQPVFKSEKHCCKNEMLKK